MVAQTSQGKDRSKQAPGTSESAFTLDIASAAAQWADLMKRLATVNRDCLLKLTRIFEPRVPAVPPRTATPPPAEDPHAAPVDAQPVHTQPIDTQPIDAEPALTLDDVPDLDLDAAAEHVEEVFEETVEAAPVATLEPVEDVAVVPDDRQLAHDRYRGWSKSELVAELVARSLPKSGNIPALIERLVNADTK